MDLIFLLFYIIVFIFGLAVGSFLNSLIYRLENEKKLSGRSVCPYCAHKLSWCDLVPVFSFLFLVGQCRYCQKKISWQYPVVEISTGLMFLFIFTFLNSQLPTYNLNYFVNLAFLFYIASSLLVIFVYDLKHSLIPDAILFWAIGLTVVYQLLTNHRFFLFNSLWVGLAASAFFAVIFFISRGAWMGFGDVKLAVLLGFILGFPNVLLGVFLAFLFGAIIGGGLIILGKKKLKSQMPFAPFLIAGTFVPMFWGKAIIYWYISLFAF